MISWPALLLLLPLVSASPLERRGKKACGQYDTITSGPYSLLTDLWGEYPVTPNWQCSTLGSVSSNTVTWSTEWAWTETAGIKSFSNVQLNAGINQQLSAIASMKSTWKWSLTQSGSGNLVADVSYDFFTSHTAGGSEVNEVMIWLANFDAKPISYGYDYDGKAVPIVSNLAIAGQKRKWDLYAGFNGHQVYSFLPVGGAIYSFSGDTRNFFKYLIDKGYVTSSEYLVIAQAGTEVTSGSATLNSAYKLTID